ncbi:sulfoxide reductase catalytic subunit YedY [Constrictibacter sp. MBR-5]|jgi:sulfoxide reductase catalytic subunit YedY|uniref:protein-methionine-sulfoxide reductase catalytic subunit MsrP n=1 Tax=Constrictibacter sp. MBR-5 TaxID=3156467 RepID=UPI003393D319
MLIRRRRGWEIPESAATPESLFFSRRAVIAAAAAAPAVLAAGSIGAGMRARAATAEGPAADLYPAARNPAFTLDRPLTDEAVATSYNNFYEFGTSKDIVKAAQKLPIQPWQVKIDGMVEKEMTLDFDELVRKMPLEERLYRHRCVEAWSMAVPWTGFPLAKLVAMAKPLGSAKFLKMQTFQNAAVAPGQKQFWYPWPYTEGLRMDEANNDLAFLVTGIYGKPVPKQNGAPLRLALPWKYGFKSIKSIVRFTFTDEQPVGYWEALQSSEYGFYANVNPEVSHPRWSQAKERLIGTDEMVPTQLYNGYAEQVAGLYTGMDPKKIYY